MSATATATATATAGAADVDRRTRAWNMAMAASPGPLDLTIPADAIAGVVPGALRGGRLLSNGPGWTHIGGRTAHPFDGHGYVRAFAFDDDGGCRLRARFVHTPSYLAEREAGQLVHRGLGTNLPPPFWRSAGVRGPVRNVANTTIQRVGDRLLAGWEGGAPYALDADSLETMGEEHFGGAIAGQATLAHFKRDARNIRLVACSLRNGRQTTLTFREIDDDGAVVQERSAAIPGMVFAHDFALTTGHVVVGGNPLRPRVAGVVGMLAGASTMLQAIAPDLEKPGVLYLVPREGDGPMRTIQLPGPAFVVHFGNAFERDGAVVVDAAVFSRFSFGEEFGYTGPLTPFDPRLPDARGPQRLLRITIPAGKDTATWAPLVPHGVDFPRFHPEHEGIETPALFGATRKDTRFSDPFDSILRVDLLDPERPPALWTAPADVFVGEPVFAPDPARPEAGHILAILSEPLAGRTTLAIFDALALEAGPVARVPLPLLPVAFHGAWDP
jgi:all-trans-8'-apo-beta-carotenal 15,15'-oxygenase